MNRAQDIVKRINRYGLKVASRREMTFFGASCVAEAYVRLLKKLLRFSYSAVGIFGKKERVAFLFNEPRIANLVGTALRQRKGKWLASALNQAAELHRFTMPKLTRALGKVRKNPKQFLRLATQVYPRYLAGMGIYNCFWRFVGNDPDKLPARYVRKIAARRERAATLYPRVEAALWLATRLLGRQVHLDGRLLAYLTMKEMREFLNRGSLPDKNEIERRSRAYFYLLIEDRKGEVVITNRKDLAAVQQSLLVVKDRPKVIHGQVGYPGRARGVVYNLEHYQGARVPKHFILVTSATHPNIISLVKKSAAIVANEGGILSHAAVVAREFQIPCIIGTKIATKVFKDGDMVEVDATKGIVRKV